MRVNNQEQAPLHKNKAYYEKFADPPSLNAFNRPYRGIFLTLFLLSAGLLFFSHGVHRYYQYSLFDLIAIWTLSTLLIIPGAYFTVIIIAIESGVSDMSYRNHPQLSK